MKYMIMMFGELGAAVQDQSPEWITNMHELLVKLDGELRDNGELMASQKLTHQEHRRPLRTRSWG
jgi:hypothetical protein